MRRLVVTLNFLLFCMAPPITKPAEVWDGATITVNKQGGEQTVDNITPEISLTRGGSAGLYNPVAENSWSSTSPSGTAWAFAGINGNLDDASFAASNFENLNFDTWLQALGGTGMAGANIENRRGVLHLIQEDIYIDILFTFWEPGPTEEGNFTYMRSSRVLISTHSLPMPAAMSGVMFVLFLLFSLRLVQRLELNST